jgi:tetratricopeptide (TPR) repeat protein
VLGEQLTMVGGIAESAELSERALAGARVLGDEALEWEARMARLRARLYEQPAPSPDELRAEAAVAIEALGRLGDERGLGRAWAMAAQAPWGEGRGAETVEAAQRSIDHATRAGDDITRGRSIRTLVGALVFGPTPASEAARRCREILAGASEGPQTVASATLALAALEAMSGSAGEAAALVARGRALVDDLGVRLTRMKVAQIATLVALHAADPELAAEEAREGYAIATSLRAEGAQVELAALLAEALHAAGRDDEAMIFADEANATATDTVDNVRWRFVKASILGERGDAAASERLAREAVEFASRTDFLRLRGDAWLALAAVLKAAGDGDGAAEARAAALALYEQKGDVVSAARARVSAVGTPSLAPPPAADRRSGARSPRSRRR